jgi:tyrosyl-tRNA synthetase
VDSDGRKFGKSEAGAVWLSADKLSPYKFYQYLFSTIDADVARFLRMLTFLPLQEIDEIEASMSQDGYRPNTAQRRLAEEVTRFVHGDEGVQVCACDSPEHAVQCQLRADTLAAALCDLRGQKQGCAGLLCPTRFLMPMPPVVAFQGALQ